MLLYPIFLRNKALQTPSPSQQIVMRSSNEMFYSHQSVNPQSRTLSVASTPSTSLTEAPLLSMYLFVIY